VTRSATASGPPRPAQVAGSKAAGRPVRGPGDRARRALRAVARSVPLALLYALLVVLVLVPVGFVVYASLLKHSVEPGDLSGSLTLSHYSDLFQSANLTSSKNSLIIGVFGTLIAVGLGGSLAWLAARTDIPCKRLVKLSAITPLFISTLVAALAWSYLAAPDRGFLNLIIEAIGLPVNLNIYSLGGIVFVMGVYYAPYSFLLLYGAFQLANPELEQVARVHGASFRTVLRRITIPLIWPTMMGASLLTFVLILENFAVPQVLGTPGRISTLPSYIYRLMTEAPPRSNVAAAVGVLLLVFVAAVVIVQQWLVSRRQYASVAGKGLKPDLVSLGRWRWPVLCVVGVYVLLTVVLPILALIEVSLRPFTFLSGAGDLFDTSKFSIDNFTTLFANDSFWPSLKNTLLTGAIAAVVGGLLYFVMSYCVYRTKTRGRRFIELIGMAPLGIPALIMGLGFLWTWLSLPLPIYGTLWVLIIAYVARFMPEGLRATSSGMIQVHSELEESARVSGAGPLRAVSRVTLPLIRSSIVASVLLVFILSIREFSAVIFLYTDKTQVLPTLLFNLYRQAGSNQAAALSLMYVVLLGLVTVVASRWMSFGNAKAGHGDEGVVESLGGQTKR
jgi:iron(III) transport system permease protein